MQTQQIPMQLQPQTVQQPLNQQHAGLGIKPFSSAQTTQPAKAAPLPFTMAKPFTLPASTTQPAWGNFSSWAQQKK
jgi:hypothetical protein